MRLKVCSILLLLSFNLYSQSGIKEYRTVLENIKGMLEETKPLSFKDAVFEVENVYLDNKLSYSEFNSDVKFLVSLCKNIISNDSLLYNREDKAEVIKNAAIFKVMTDTIPIIFNSDMFKHYGYSYDFEDIWGEKDWTQMFVSKLLVTHKGNCHSLPYLYKILSDTIGSKAYFALAPNHIYIKCRNNKDGWYNTELTSATFPMDYWVMASGYISLDAIQNGIYMDTLDERQSLALCVTDLAKGYESKYGRNNNPAFVIECCDIALKYYPNYVNALLLKAESYKAIFEGLMKKYNAKYPKDIFSIKEAKDTFDTMEGIYTNIFELGYRNMPKQMYMSWLAELQKERSKYLNKDTNKINKSIK